MNNIRGWTTTKVVEVASKMKAGGTPNRSNQNYWQGEIPFVLIEDMTKIERFLIETKEYISRLGLQSSSAWMVPENSILLSMYATLGKVVINKIPVATNQAILGIIPAKVDRDFLYYLLQFSADRLSKLNSQTTQKNLNKQIVSNFEITYPVELTEQRAIAEILTMVDDAIEQTEALIRKHQRIKQGLMQDLLTRGVDENGELRPYDPMNFRNTSIGMIPSNWRIGTINDFAINLDSKRVPLKQEDRAKMKGDYPYYGASGVIDWINDFIFDGKYILIGEDGENVISRNLPLAFKASGKFWVNNHAHVYQPLPEINISFLVELLENVDYSKYISGSAQPKLTQNILSKISLPVPPFEEQKRIGIVIDIVNDLILIEKKSLAKWHSLKFGLMQDLLTGKVRVNALLEQ